VGKHVEYYSQYLKQVKSDVVRLCIQPLCIVFTIKFYSLVTLPSVDQPYYNTGYSIH